jgi:hypothetical protein
VGPRPCGCLPRVWQACWVSHVGAHLDEVAVSVAEVDAADGASGAGASTGPSSMSTWCAASSSVAWPSGSVLIRRRLALPGVRTVGLGIELVTGLMQIDLGVAEDKRGAACAERHCLHAENVGVEGHGGVEVGDSQYQMIEPVDAHAPYRR